MTLDELNEAIDTFKLPELRDRFAMAALTGLLAARSPASHDPGGTLVDTKALAREAYEIADAMVVEMGDGRALAAERDPKPEGGKS